jgi:hypothetical protein
MNSKRRFALALGLLAVVLGCPLVTPVSGFAQQSPVPVGDAQDPDMIPASDPWRFALKPFLFLSGLSGSVTLENATFPINSSFGDLIDNLRVGGFLSLAGTKGRWGFFADIEYISLKGTGSGQVPTELRLDTLIGELDATYSPSRDSNLWFVGGARMFDVGQSLLISDRPALETSITVVDPIVGAVGSWALGDSWLFRMRGDIGGFGVGSEFTYQLMMELQWQISDTVGLPFGYRVLSYQIRKDSSWLDTRLSGLFLGLNFTF